MIGESGAGKSTLCDILAGLYPNDCAITLDGHTAVPDHSALRGAIAYVPQAASPWRKTVRQALSPDAGADDPSLWEALTKVGLEARIRTRPEGLNAPLGDSGIALSGGELQRLMLAQALLRKPRLLILDEITSALDSETENTIIRTLRAARDDMAIVVVTHRSALAESADHCYRILGTGSDRRELTVVTKENGQEWTTDEVSKENRLA